VNETCDKCKAEILDMEDVGYMGPVDRGSNECHPFMAFAVICKKCEGEK